MTWVTIHNEPHPFVTARRSNRCLSCGGWPDAPCHSAELWTGTDLERIAARQIAQAQELSAEIRRPLKDVSRTTGIMERESPLFHGTGANPTLF
jgi:hypothetical protein